MHVFDASPLIVLATADRLALVTALDGPCCLPASASEEVVEAGIDAGHTDARRLEQAIEDGLFAVHPDPDTALADRLGRFDRLSHADVSVLALAAQHDGTAVMDEQAGRTVADIEDIPAHGTAYIVLNAQQQGYIDPTEARTVVGELVEAGWYCSPALHARLLDKIDELG
jgi:predicted nucleic acid-binding protein